MRNVGSCARVALVLLLVCAGAAAANQNGQPQPKQWQPNAPKRRVIYIPPPVKRLPGAAPTSCASQVNGSAASTIPYWCYTTTAYDAKTYQGMMVGRSPFAHGHRSTTIPTFVVPVALTFKDTGTVFDPSQADGCLPNNDTVDNVLSHSPIFQSSDFVMNTVDVGSAQYLDAFQRASFWKQVQGTPYHTVFSGTPTVLSAVSVTVPVADGSTQPGFCGVYGQMDLGWFDNMVQTTIIPQLAAQGVGPANFPQLIFDSVVMYLNGDPNQCCVLGYHSAFINGGTFQTYSVNNFDTAQVFVPDTQAMAHEVGEWMDDPDGSNAVPSWGAEGQVTAGNCQGNLEVGDPLSPGFGTPSNTWTVTLNSFDYHLQELAFFSWFYGQSPSFGAGGGYSDNSTFSGFAKACPPGGTN
jgi:hypothetical protein